MRRVFLDANVYFAGCYSPHGASALLLELARAGHIQVVASRLVLREAERNLRRKAGHTAVRTFHRFLAAAKVVVVRAPTSRVLARYEAAIHPKDVPVLAAALEAKVDDLVTLDRRDFFVSSVRSRAGQVRIVTPGEFLRDYLGR